MKNLNSYNSEKFNKQHHSFRIKSLGQISYKNNHSNANNIKKSKFYLNYNKNKKKLKKDTSFDRKDNSNNPLPSNNTC